MTKGSHRTPRAGGGAARRDRRRRRAGGTLAAALWLVVPIAPGAAPVDPSSIAGVYKNRFPNATVGGERYASENIVEIVPTSASAVYLKAHLEFYNGHVCDVHGVADVDGDTLRWTDRSHPEDAAGRCVLGIRVAPGQLVFDDADGRCALRYCGARGGFHGETIDRSRRREIRYLPRLKSSKDFTEAVAEHDRR